MRDAIGNTKTAAVSFYYAYKSDQYLRKRGLGRTEVQNVMAWLNQLCSWVREPSLILPLQCMAPITALTSSQSSEFHSVADRSTESRSERGKE